MNTAFNQRHHLNRWCVVSSRESIYAACEQKWKTCKRTICDFWMWQNRSLYVAIGANWMVESRICRKILDSSVQAGMKVRGVSEINENCNVTFVCCVCGISALDIAGTHRQLCIANYMYRYASGKNYYFNWFAHQACTHTLIWLIFVSKGHLSKWASDQH